MEDTRVSGWLDRMKRDTDWTIDIIDSRDGAEDRGEIVCQFGGARGVDLHLFGVSRF